MDKTNFKKFALMGMAGGMLVASQTPVEANAADLLSDTSHIVVAHSCGGGKCGAPPQQTPSNRGIGSSKNYTAYDTDTTQQRRTSTYQDSTNRDASNRQMTESEFLSKLNPDTKKQYQNLSSEAKAEALRLAPSYSDKNQAVKVAAQKTSDRNRMPSTGRSDSRYNQ